MSDTRKTALDSSVSALKITDVKTGTITTPATTSSVTVTNTIPHGFGSDNILVACTSTFPTNIGTVIATTPATTSTEGIVVEWDATNVYVRATAASAGGTRPSIVWNYTLSIIVP